MEDHGFYIMGVFLMRQALALVTKYHSSEQIYSSQMSKKHLSNICNTTEVQHQFNLAYICHINKH